MAVKEIPVIPCDIVSRLVCDASYQALPSIWTNPRGHDRICTLKIASILSGPLLVPPFMKMTPGKKDVVISSFPLVKLDAVARPNIYRLEVANT